MGEYGEDIFNLGMIISDQEKLSRQCDEEAYKFHNKGLRALAAWKRKDALKYKQIADWLKELDKRRLRESLDD